MRSHLGPKKVHMPRKNNTVDLAGASRIDHTVVKIVAGIGIPRPSPEIEMIVNKEFRILI